MVSPGGWVVSPGGRVVTPGGLEGSGCNCCCVRSTVELCLGAVLHESLS